MLRKSNLSGRRRGYFEWKSDTDEEFSETRRRALYILAGKIVQKSNGHCMQKQPNLKPNLT